MVNIFKINKKKLAEITKANRVKHLSVFGSIARGDANKTSDVDLLVELLPQGDLFDLAGLKIDMEFLLKRKVDIATPASLDRRVRHKILAEAETF